MCRLRRWTQTFLPCVLIVLCPPAGGETARLGSLPGKPGRTGFLMKADIDVVAGCGYQPFYLSFSPTGKAFQRDRHLQVAIEPRHYFRTDLDFSLLRSITIAEGSASHRVVVYVPHYYPWDTVGIRLLEDGRPVESGEAVLGIGGGLRARFADQTTSVGILSPADVAVPDEPWMVYPDVRTLVTVLGNGPLPEDANIKRLPHQDAIKRAGQVQGAEVQFRPLDESQLHDHWLGYSQLDVMIVAEPVLERIANQRRAEFQHLQDWLAAGGNLWVYAATDRTAAAFEGTLRLQAVDPARILPPGRVASALNLKADNDTSMLIQEPRLYYQSYSGVQKESMQYAWRSDDVKFTRRGDIFKKLKNVKHPFAQSVSPAEIASDVRVGRFGLGTLVTIGAEDPFPGSFQFWRSIVNLHDDGQLVWTKRMGIDVPLGNENYWMWLIPSVGQPPVKSFVVLNTLFVILVGPVCYFFFRRRQRLYLLYFFAPCLAMVVTVSLFAYALGADGTRTKLRARQLTWIDSTSGYAVGQWRQTYYAVLGSGDGLTFPRDAAVYPVRNTPAFQRYYRHSGQRIRGGEIRLQGEQRLLSGSFLPARDQVQYLCMRPKRWSGKGLDFVPAGEPGASPTLTNRLDGVLHRVIVRDAKGEYWRGEDLLPGQSATLMSCSPASLQELLGPQVLPPLGTVPMLQRNRRFWGTPGAGVQVSLLEKRLESWSRQLPKNCFVARTELDEGRLGVEDAVPLASVHVVMGEIP